MAKKRYGSEGQRRRALSRHAKLREAAGLPEPSAHERELRRARNARYVANKNGQARQSNEKQTEDRAA
jgi:hypothetical protein